MQAPLRIFSNSDLKKLIIPLVIEQFLAMLVGMSDTMMVATLGESAVSGVSLVDMINNLIICVFGALATGGAVVASQHIGAKNHPAAAHSAAQLLFITAAIAVAVAGLCLLLNRQLIRLFFGAIDSEVMRAASTYFYVTAVSFPCIGVYNACAALQRAMGNSRVSMYSSLLANLLNIGGNALLIFVFDLGVFGAAAATLFSRFVGMLVMLRLLRDESKPIYLQKHFRVDLPQIRSILHIGVPNGVESGLFQLGRVAVVSIISGFGTVQIAANAVASNIAGLGCVAGSAMGLAVITVIGQCVGAGDEEQVRFYIKKLMKLTYVVHILWNLVLFLVMPLLMQAYDLTAETLHLALLLIILHNVMGMLLWPMSFVFPNALRAANDVKYTMVVAVLSMLLVRICTALVLGVTLEMGAMGVWMAMILDWVCRGICFLARYRRGHWVQTAHLRPMAEEERGHHHHHGRHGYRAA